MNGDTAHAVGVATGADEAAAPVRSSRVQSVELLFDPRTEAALVAAWASLRAAGLPSLATHRGTTNRPHITVAVAHAGLDAAVPALSEVLSSRLPPEGLPVVVGGPVLFGGHRRRWVLARAVVLSRALQALHEAVHDGVAAATPGVPVEALTRPDAWSPHATLARRVTAERLGDALSPLDLSPLEGRVVGARLWDSGPRSVTDLA